MIGKIGLGVVIWSGFATVADWLMNTPNAAAMRAIGAGSALGMLGVGLRVITGLERRHLAGGGE